MSLFKTKEQKIANRLYKALEYNDLDKLKQAAAEGASVNKSEYSRYGMSPVSAAAHSNFTEGVKFLIEQGGRDDEGRNVTALHYAVENNNLAVVTMLLDSGANIEARRYDSFTPLHLAARRGYGNIIRALMARGADVDARDEHMNTPADLAEKEYPRLSDLIRGTTAQQKLLEPAAEEWRMTSPGEICRVDIKPAIGYRVTEIFNFTAGLYTQIARNLETNAESQAVQAIASLDEHVVEAARAALQASGGIVPETPVKKRLQNPAN